MKEKEYSNLLSLIKSVAVTIVCTYILYLPIFIINGTQTVLGNEYVLPQSIILILKNLPNYFLELSAYLFSEFQYGWIFYLIIILSIILFLTFKRDYDNTSLIFILINLILPLVFIIGQRVLPPYRVYIYLSIPICIWTTFVSEKLFKNNYLPYLLLILFQLHIFWTLFTERLAQYERAQKLANKLIQLNAEKYIFGDSYNAMIFEFEFYKQNKKYELAYDETINQKLTFVYYKDKKNPEVVDSY